MKKLFILVALATLTALGGCSKYTIASDWYKKNCTEHHNVNLQTGEATVSCHCGNLYPTEQVQAVCNEANICYDAANASLEATVSCGDSTTNVFDVFYKMISAAIASHKKK